MACGDLFGYDRAQLFNQSDFFVGVALESCLYLLVMFFDLLKYRANETEEFIGHFLVIFPWRGPNVEPLFLQQAGFFLALFEGFHRSHSLGFFRKLFLLFLVHF